MWWVNGEQNNQIMADSRGLAYGDGLFETMRYVKGEIPLLTQHMERLFRGADILGLHINHDVLDVQLRQADQWLSSQGAAQAMLKLMVVRRSTAAGYAPQGERSVDGPETPQPA